MNWLAVMKKGKFKIANFTLLHDMQHVRTPVAELNGWDSNRVPITDTFLSI
jgi:hypothetical protein